MNDSGHTLATATQRVAAAVAEWVPLRVKIALRGKRSAPGRVAGAIHNFLNRVPGTRYPTLTCSGPLKGYRMRLDWNKHRSFAYGSWEPEVVDAVSRVVRPGMRVIDIGAHGGFYALLLAKLVGASGAVVAFEPLPANFRMLKENVAMNGLSNVTIERSAVCSHSGQFQLEVPDVDAAALAGPMEDSEQTKAMTVSCVSLDDYFSLQRVRTDFIKMDVEGAEGDVLEGAKDILTLYHPTMMIELHNVGHAETHPVALYLRKIGYSIEWLSEAGYTVHTLARWARSDGDLNPAC